MNLQTLHDSSIDAMLQLIAQSFVITFQFRVFSILNSNSFFQLANPHMLLFRRLLEDSPLVIMLHN